MLNQNLTFLIQVQYMFNFSFDVFEISFIYAAFLSFLRFYLFNLSSKSTCFCRRSDSHWTILSEKLFLCNQIYRLFHAFSFLIIPSDDLLCDMKHITVSFSDTRKILQARFSVCGRQLQRYNSSTPQCAPAWKALLSLHLYVCYRNITK